MTTATSESLFIKKLDPNDLFEKEASIARMPDDDRKWPETVLSELHKQLPFLSGMDIALNFTRIQPQAGYGFGYALVRGQVNAAALQPKDENQMVKIPIVVADRHLEPFHVFNFEGRTFPLTQSRFEEALENPRMFAGPATTPKTQKSLIDQLYPPYQQRQGFGRTGEGAGMLGAATGMGKTASEESERKRELIRRTLYGAGGAAMAGPIGAGIGGMIASPAGEAGGIGMPLAGSAVGNALGSVVAGSQGARVGEIVGGGIGGAYSVKEAKAISEMTPEEIQRLSELKRNEGLDKAQAGLTQRDKRYALRDRLLAAGLAGAGLGGAKKLFTKADDLKSTAGVAKTLGMGAATGIGVNTAVSGVQGYRRKKREQDRSSDTYKQHFKKASMEDIPNYTMAQEPSISCKTCQFYGSSTEMGAGVCNKFSADVKENMVCGEWAADPVMAKEASFNKFLMGNK